MRPFFPERVRAQLRDMNVYNLTDRATIYHIEEGPRPEREPHPVTDATGVPCRLAPTSLRLPIEGAIAGQFGADVKWVVIFEAGTNVPENSRIIVTGSSNGVAWEKRLEVIAQLIRESEMFRHVACEELPESKQ